MKNDKKRKKTTAAQLSSAGGEMSLAAGMTVATQGSKAPTQDPKAARQGSKTATQGSKMQARRQKVSSKGMKGATKEPKGTAGKPGGLTVGPRMLRWWRWCLPLVALVVVGVGLLMLEAGMLFRVQELNLFLYTPLFFKQQMVVAGGLLSYLGAYFTQFFYHPWLGVLLLCGWWGVVMVLTKHVFRIPDRWTVLLLIPLALLVLTDVTLGYWIFYLKFHGQFFAASIGVTVTLLLVWAFRVLPPRWFLRTAFMLVALVVGYPFFGVYALAAVALMAVLDLRLPDERVGHQLVNALVALLSFVLVPLAYYRLWFYQTSIENIYNVGLPVFGLSQTYYQYYIPYLLLAVFLVAMAVLYGRWREGEVPRVGRWILTQVGIMAVVVAAVCHFWYRDENFHKEIGMARCVENLDWEGVLSIARDADDEPTRMMWMLKNLALFRLGRQGDEMYRFKNGAKPCAAPFVVRLTQTGGKLLYMHYGRVNFCYRWCMEDGVERGWNVDIYRMMLRCSLINGEYTVAQKYIDILKQTKYYAQWAERYEAYLRHPRRLRQDTELQPIFRLLPQRDELKSDNTLIEIFLLNDFAYDDSDDPLYQEQTLLAALQTKDIPTFWARFAHYAQLHRGERMPVHYQEAAYLYGHLENKVDISRMPFDKDVVERYNAFMAKAQSLHGMTEEEMKPLMYDEFGGTFFFDYFFMRNQKSY